MKNLIFHVVHDVVHTELFTARKVRFNRTVICLDQLRLNFIGLVLTAF